MYYPYLRGKQFELILLRDNSELIAKNNIHPIIEPVKNNFSSLTNAVKSLFNNKAACTLVVNPHAGQTPVPMKNILHELIDDSYKDFTNIFIGYILQANSNIKELADLLKKYHKNNFSIIHNGYTDAKTRKHRTI